MTESIVCLTESANPAQSILASRKFSLYLLNNGYLLANKSKRRNLKELVGSKNASKILVAIA